MVWRTWIFLLGGSCFSPAAFAEAPLQGLLTLPEVFGELPCEVFEPKEIPFSVAPHPRRISAEFVSHSHGHSWAKVVAPGCVSTWCLTRVWSLNCRSGN